MFGISKLERQLENQYWRISMLERDLKKQNQIIDALLNKLNLKAISPYKPPIEIIKDDSK